jgi:crotonobetainyl-CoA:carnitine CoA-transferase CaiB-like acyl-CoA transferase
MTVRTGGGYALEGVGVLDLAGEVGGFGSRLLADLGARVIKVEEPGGDPSRNAGSPPAGDPGECGSLSFRFENANKLGITLNLRTGEGRRIFLELVKRSDVVMEAHPPGGMDALGLGTEALREANPSVVVVSVTGFGREGPRSGYRTSDRIASAFGGQMFICGEPGEPPRKPYGRQSYYSASLFAAIAALAGLREKRKGGKNLSFDISVQEAVAATLEHVLVRYFHGETVSGREGSLHWDRAFRIFPCRDGFILMTLFHQWPTLVEWMAGEGMAGDLQDGKWEDESFRRDRIDHVIEVIGRWTMTHTTRELFEMGQSLRFPWAPVRSPAEVLDCPQLSARNFFMGVEQPEGARPLEYPGTPCRYGMPVPEKWEPPPRPGEHNRRIFHEELGIPLREMEALRSRGVI